MINLNSHETFAGAFIEGLKDLLQHGHHAESVKDPITVGSNWGKGDRPSLELLGYSFQVDNPYSCLFLSNTRLLRLPYLYGLFIWSLAGSNKVDWLSYYHPSASKFSDDGIHLFGAFGKRIFNYQENINQIDIIGKRIIKDAGARRTFASICTPEDNILNSREYPCCIGVQYFLRDNSIDAITYMRSQSALGVLPYDAFLFMLLQCFLADKLKVNVGCYKHFIGTFHVYEAEIEDAKKVISQEIVPITVGRIASEADVLEEIFVFERTLRDATLKKQSSSVLQLASITLNPQNFWDQARIVLLLHSFILLELREEAKNLVKQLPAPLQILTKKYLEITQSSGEGEEIR